MCIMINKMTANTTVIIFSLQVVVITVSFQCVSYAGENQRYVYTNLPKPFGLSVFGSELYWTDANLKKVGHPNGYFVIEIAQLFERPS